MCHLVLNRSWIPPSAASGAEAASACRPVVGSTATPGWHAPNEGVAKHLVYVALLVPAPGMPLSQPGDSPLSSSIACRNVLSLWESLQRFFLTLVSCA